MSKRFSRLETLMQIAVVLSARSTCERLHVGALVHREGRILVTGYNGAPTGLDHCDHSCTCPDSVLVTKTHDKYCAVVMPCTVAQHAERNCIDWAARHGIRLEGAEMVTTDAPCAQCAGSIINAGIVSVLADREYRDRTGVQMLVAAGVRLDSYADMIG